MFRITPVVETLLIASAAIAGLAVGFDSRKSATAPATCGDAIEVPLIVLYEAFEEFQVLKIPEPGAAMSTLDAP